MKAITYDKLQPGMVCEDWDNAGKVIDNVKRIVRPTMRYDLVLVSFCGGGKVQATTKAKMNVRGGVPYAVYV